MQLGIEDHQSVINVYNMLIKSGNKQQGGFTIAFFSSDPTSKMPTKQFFTYILPKLYTENYRDSLGFKHTACKQQG